VRVLFDTHGARLDLPFERNLWEPQLDRGGGDGALENVVSPLDPAELNIDPLTYLESA